MKTSSGKLDSLFDLFEEWAINIKCYFGDPEFLVCLWVAIQTPETLRNRTLPLFYQILTRIFLFYFIFIYPRKDLPSKYERPKWLNLAKRKNLKRDLYSLNLAISKDIKIHLLFNYCIPRATKPVISQFNCVPLYTLQPLGLQVKFLFYRVKIQPHSVRSSAGSKVEINLGAETCLYIA